MGTNYYLKTKICPHCKAGGETIHIGKSSGGWYFALHVDPERGFANLDDWKSLFTQPNSKIFDEYNKEISVEEMLKTITERTWPRVKDWTQEEYDQNHAQPGINGLARHKIEAGHCVSHGDGTWDCIVGEFS